MAKTSIKIEDAGPGPVCRAAARTRDKEVTVPAILEAACAVFAQYGLQGARTEDIASRAGIAKGLVFHYFKSKELLFEAVLERAYEPLREVLDTPILLSTPPEAALVSLVEKLLAAMMETPHGPAIFILESIQNGGKHYRKLGMPSLYRSLESLLRRGIRMGVFRKMDPYHASVNIIGLCAFYFCAMNNFDRSGGAEDPMSTKALTRHSREVLAFVAAATRPK